MKENLLNVYETDERMYFLRRLLLNSDIDKRLYVFAPNILIEPKHLDEIEDGSYLIYGKCTDEVIAIAANKNIKLCNIMQDERFQAVNSRLTAEGALMLMLEHSLKSIEDCRVLVLGFGRMGAAVVGLLHRLAISTDVATTSSLRPAFAFADYVVPMHDFDFAHYDIVINTVPYPVVCDKDLMSMRSDAVYIDLASKPAINLEYAHYLGIDADIYPALPAKTCPYSAAVAMQEYITEVTK